MEDAEPSHAVRENEEAEEDEDEEQEEVAWFQTSVTAYIFEFVTNSKRSGVAPVNDCFSQVVVGETITTSVP